VCVWRWVNFGMTYLSYERYPILSLGIISTMPNKERSIFRRIPTPTLAVTNIGVVTIAPELRKNSGEVFRAIRLGMDLDDFWDFGIFPRPVSLYHCEDSSRNPLSDELYERYFDSYRSFIDNLNHLSDEEKIRISKNTGWFVSTVHYLEGKTISMPVDFWNPETVKDYRESVALIWAMYLASLMRNSNLNLYETANISGCFSIDDCKRWLADPAGMKLEKLYSKRMFYGALVFQVVSDYGKRAYAMKNYLPSFGGIGFEDFSDEELQEYVELMKNHYTDMAVANGVDRNSLGIFLKIFPKIQKVLNALHKSKDASFWAYS